MFENEISRNNTQGRYWSTIMHMALIDAAYILSSVHTVHLSIWWIGGIIPYYLLLVRCKSFIYCEDLHIKIDPWKSIWRQASN